MARDRKMQARCTADQEAAMRARAQQAGLTLSEYVRRAALPERLLTSAPAPRCRAVSPYAKGGTGPVSAGEVKKARLRVADALDPWRRRVHLLRVYVRAVRDYFA